MLRALFFDMDETLCDTLSANHWLLFDDIKGGAVSGWSFW